MSVTAHATPGSWAHLHRAALLVVVLSLALAATIGLLAARVLAGSTPASTSSVSTVHLNPTDNGCQLARPGLPRPC
jgi:hypothetical protein